MVEILFARKTDIDVSLTDISTLQTTNATTEFITAAAASGLGAERVLTNTVSVTWDFSTPGQAKATAVAAGLAPNSADNTILADMAQSTIKGRAAGAGTGDPQDLTPAQVQAILGMATVSTDNVVVRYDGTTGGLQGSPWTLSDAGALTPTADDGGALGTTALKVSDLFLASGAIINFASGDVLISHGTNVLQFSGATSGYTFDNFISPITDDGAAIGTTSIKWADIFLASGAVINFNAGDVTITHAANQLNFQGATVGYYFQDGPVGPLTSDGAALGGTGNMWSDLFLASGAVVNWNNGDVLLTHSANTLAWTGASSGYTFDAALRPSANDAAALGSATVSWADLFLASGGVINFNNGDVTITHASNVLAFGGAASGYQFAELVVPATNDGAPLGSTILQWSDLFLASGAVINFANGDVTITHSANALNFVGAANGYGFDTTLIPTANDGAALGVGTQAFSDLFLASGGVINWNNGDVLLTHSSNVLAHTGASSGYTFDALIDISNAAAGQIKFPAAQNASADVNTLDDYEEGTWTPALTFDVAGNLNVVYATQVGHYTKIGRQVAIWFEVNASTFTHTTATGNLRMTGLPFTAAGGSINFRSGSVAWQGITKAGYTDLVPDAVAANTYMLWVISGSGVNVGNVTVADALTGSVKYLSGGNLFNT